jgi:hypothetical protein
MTNIDAVLTDTNTNILVPLLAPYQPSVLPDYPNPLPTAGQIPPTLVTTGHPLQYNVTTRLENKQCQTALYEDENDKADKLTPYINHVAYENQPTLSGTPPSGIVYRSVGRSVRRVFLDVWAYSGPTRAAIGDLLRQYLTDVFRVTHSDGTISLFTFRNQIDWNGQEIDSIFVRRFQFECDFVVTIPVNVTEILEAQARLAVKNQLTGTPVHTATATVVPPAPTTASVLTPPWDQGQIRP